MREISQNVGKAFAYYAFSWKQEFERENKYIKKWHIKLLVAFLIFLEDVTNPYLRFVLFWYGICD